MYFPESEKLRAKAPSKEEDIANLDQLLHRNNGRVIILSHTAFHLDMTETNLYEFLKPYIESGTLTKVDRAKCPVCPDEIIEVDFSPTGKNWHCCHCGKDFSEDQVKTVDCFQVKAIPDYIELEKISPPPIVMEKEGSILDKEALTHGKIRPWKDLEKSEYTLGTNQLNSAAEEWILESLEKRGFCLVRLEGQTPQPEILLAIEKFLGPAIENQNGAISKIKEISPKEAIEATTGDSARALAFHTDGTQEQKLPPAILAFQYLTTPKFGSRSTFIDLASVIQDMDEAELEEILKDLARPDVATSHKKGLSYTGPLVIPVRNSQSLSFRLRFDSVMTVIPESQGSFNKLKDAILNQTDYLSYAPQEGDIAIFDNWRVMHGRDAVGGTHMRFHNRMWIGDLKQSVAAKHLLGVRGLSAKLLVELREINQSGVK